MKCYSEFAMLYEQGEVSTADEPKTILGATVDKEDNTILITYPHAVQKIKIDKEKEPKLRQISEWRTRYRLTSAVVHDAGADAYLAVLHQDTVKLSADLFQLDAAYKYTFRLPIYKILTRTHKPPLILFRNGDCLSLPRGLELCRTFSRKAVVKESASIVEASAYSRGDTEHVCCILKDRSSRYSVLSYSLQDDMCDQRSVRVVKVSDAREAKCANVSVKGCCIVAGASENPSICFTWSDAYFGMYDVVKNCWKIKFYPMPTKCENESTLVCLKRNLIVWSGKYHDVYDESNNSSYTFTAHRSLPDMWSFGGVILTPYSPLTRIYDCEDHLVVVEPSRVTVWSVTVTGRGREPYYWNDSERLVQHLKPDEYLPIFGNPNKIKRCGLYGKEAPL